MAAPEKERINRGEEESSEQIHHEANSDQRLADIVSFLPDPTFGIDKKGIVISWNRAMEDLTGIGAIDILGKGDYEYAVPFEGVKRPVLVDLVLNQDPKLESEYNSLQRDGMNLTDEIFLPSFGKNGSYIWAKAAPLFDNSGDIIGAVESLRDITERKRSEEALKESESKFRLLFERSADAMFLLDDEKFIDCNKAAMDIMKCSDKEELLDLHPSQTAPERQPDGRLSFEKAEEMMRKAFEKGTHRFEWVRRRKNGKEFPVEATLTAIPWEDRQILHLIVKDITERKRAEEKLIWNAALLEAQVESSLDGILVVDGQGKRIITNQRLLAMWNVPQSIIDDKNDEALLEYVAGRVKNPDQFLEKVMYLYHHPDETSRDEIEFKDGLVMDRYSSPVIGRDGMNYGRIWTFRDITKRKRTDLSRERSLLRQEKLNLLRQTLLIPGKLEEKLKKITDSVVDIFGADFCRIWISGPGDLCDGGCIHAKATDGPHVCRYRDRCLRLIASSGRYTHVYGESHRRVPFGCYKVGRIASGEEHRFLTNDVQNEPLVHDHEWAKEIGLVSFAGYQLRSPDEDTLGVLALFSKQNITIEEDTQLDNLSSTIAQVVQTARIDEELRQSRDELEQRVKQRTEELARKNTEMERFVYTVSHDLRSPLISMSGFLGFLKADAQKGDMKRLDADIRFVSDAVTKMDKLLLDTLELSRIGRIISPPEDVPFREIVNEALAQSSAKLSSKNVKVMVEEDLPIVQVDKMRLVEVLVNLVENSVKYMGDQPQPEIEIGKRLDGENTVFFVRDNGIGIEHSQHNKVFELFYKVDKKTEGSGAGLAIVKKII